MLLNSLSYDTPHVNATLIGNAWVGHVFFAHWLVATLKPSILVELGTHDGCSYFSFCDSVLDNGLDTKTFAVDTWIGEPHAGFYDNSVFEKVNAYNEEKFSKFSKLLRMTFDEALDEFDACSVDLLHIDGYHSYEAVSHDFVTWMPKLSNNAVVLFHDTHELRPGFGVHRFWDEIKTQNPEQCFEFDHSHGLGIYFPKSTAFAEIFRNISEINLIKTFSLFSACGESLYLDINGRSSKDNQKYTTVNELKNCLQKIKNGNPKLALEIMKSVIAT